MQHTRYGQTPSKQLPLFTPIVRDINNSHATVTIGMDKTAVSHIMQRTSQYKALPEKIRPGLEQIADYVRNDMISRTFKREGPGWARLAKRTINDRRAAGYNGAHPILYRSGDLYKELTDKSHPKHIEIIKVGKRARIEIGGSSAKFLENQIGKSSQHLPARPMVPGTGFVPILMRDRLEMSKIIERAYVRYINKPT